MRILRGIILPIAFGIVVLSTATPVFAQLKPIQTGSTDFSMAFGDVAYDPGHDAYLVVYGRLDYGSCVPPSGCPQGRFIRADSGIGYGAAPFDIRPVPDSDQAYRARAIYSPDLSNGAGGTGAFLVVWSTWGSDGIWRIFGQIVAFPGQRVGSPILIEQWRAGTTEALVGLSIAYSRTDHVFLVAANVIFGYFSAGHGYTDVVPYYIRLDLSGQPIGSFTSVKQTHDFPCMYPPHACGGLDLAWNPLANEFGLLYDDASLVFVRVRTDGSMASQTSLGPGWRSHALDVSSRTGTYVAAYVTTTATWTVEIDQGGAILQQHAVVAASLAEDTASESAMSYSPVTHTYLLDVVGLTVELNEHGIPVSPSLPSGSFWSVMAAARSIAPEWIVTTATGFARIGSGMPRPSYVPGDMTGNGVVDLIWQHPVTGAVLVWAMNGPTFVSDTLANAGGTLWQVVGTADFTGDRKSDLLWQDPSSGAVLLWEMDGTAYVRGTIVNAGGTLWRVAATGDFTGDGKADIVWQHPATGAVLLWEMDGSTYVRGTFIATGGTLWQVVGAGDFTGDGNPDLLWQHPLTGAVLVWAMNGPSYVSGTIANAGPTLWQVVAVGDYTGDGKPDIVWQYPSSGAVLLWEMDGTAYVSGTMIGAGGTPWRVRGPR